MSTFISTKEAAVRLGVGVRRIQALIAAGRLPAYKIGSSFAIRPSDLERANGRRNGRPVNGTSSKEKDWTAILAKVSGKHDFGPGDLATNNRHLEGLGRD